MFHTFFFYFLNDRVRYTLDAPEVVVQLLLSRRAEMTEAVDTDDTEKKMMEEIRSLSVRGGGLTRQVTAAPM